MLFMFAVIMLRFRRECLRHAEDVLVNVILKNAFKLCSFPMCIVFIVDFLLEDQEELIAVRI